MAALPPPMFFDDPPNSPEHPENEPIDFSRCVVCQQPIHHKKQGFFRCSVPTCRRFTHLTCQSYQLILTGDPSCHRCKSLSTADAFFWNQMVKKDGDGWTLIAKIPTLTEELSPDEN